MRCLYLLIVTLLLAGCASVAPAQSNLQSGFVKVEGTHFTIDGKPYRFAGANSGMGPTWERPVRDRQIARDCAPNSTSSRRPASTTCACWRCPKPAASSARCARGIMIKPGEYDERLLQGLDYLLVEMGRRDMKAVLYLNNFWQWSGGMSQYVSWATGEPLSDPDVSGDWNGFMQNSARFYALPQAQAWYRDAIRTVIGRTNSISGRAYVDDPTIMSWQLANEPRPGSGKDGHANIAAYDAWIDGTAAFIKTLAPQQLVSTGNEGAMGSLGDIDLYVQAHRARTSIT